MRTSEFTFKKTKRVKTVTVYNGISIDLTAQEAADLAAYLQRASTPDQRFHDLYDAVNAFARKNDATSDLKPQGISAFIMVKK